MNGLGGFTRPSQSQSRRTSRFRACPKPELLRPEAPGGTGTQQREEKLLRHGQDAKGPCMCHHQEAEGGEGQVLI